MAGGDGEEGGEGLLSSLVFIHSLFEMLATPTHVFRASPISCMRSCARTFGLALQFSAALAHASSLSHISWASLAVGQLGVVCPGPHARHPMHWYRSQFFRMWPVFLQHEQW